MNKREEYLKRIKLGPRETMWDYEQELLTLCRQTRKRGDRRQKNEKTI